MNENIPWCVGINVVTFCLSIQRKSIDLCEKYVKDTKHHLTLKLYHINMTNACSMSTVKRTMPMFIIHVFFVTNRFICLTLSTLCFTFYGVHCIASHYFLFPFQHTVAFSYIFICNSDKTYCLVFFVFFPPFIVWHRLFSFRTLVTNITYINIGMCYIVEVFMYRMGIGNLCMAANWHKTFSFQNPLIWKSFHSNGRFSISYMYGAQTFQLVTTICTTLLYQSVMCSKYVRNLQLWKYNVWFW